MNLKTHTIPRYGKLVSIDFPMYGNIFSQFMENRWGYPYLSHSWILRDFSFEPIDRFLFGTNFYRRGFSKQAIEIWILIPIIRQNMFKLHAKKIYTNYDKICVFEKKSTRKLSWRKEILSWMIWDSLLFSKSMPWLARVSIDSFFNLYMTLPWYHHDGKLMKK